MENKTLIDELLRRRYFEEALSVIKRTDTKEHLITEDVIRNNFMLTPDEVEILKKEVGHIIHSTPNGDIKYYLGREVVQKAGLVRVRRITEKYS